MPPSNALGERISSLEATVDALKDYEKEHWHKLSQDLQTLVALPERFARDIARMEGLVDGKINAVSREIDRVVIAAIEKAVQPMTADIATLREDVDELQEHRHQVTGARRFGQWFAQIIVSAVVAIAAVLALGHGK